MKVMCIDYGRKRLGAAVTDPEGTLVRGLSTIEISGNKNPLTELCTLIKHESPEKLVIGIPLDSDENETTMSREIKTFSKTLAETVSIPVEYIEESFSSKRARRLLCKRKKKHRREKKNIDRIAACLLLEEYLMDERYNQCKKY